MLGRRRRRDGVPVVDVSTIAWEDALLHRWEDGGLKGEEV